MKMRLVLTVLLALFITELSVGQEQSALLPKIIIESAQKAEPGEKVFFRIALHPDLTAEDVKNVQFDFGDGQKYFGKYEQVINHVYVVSGIYNIQGKIKVSGKEYIARQIIMVGNVEEKALVFPKKSFPLEKNVSREVFFLAICGDSENRFAEATSKLYNNWVNTGVVAEQNAFILGDSLSVPNYGSSSRENIKAIVDSTIARINSLGLKRPPVIVSLTGHGCGYFAPAILNSSSRSKKYLGFTYVAPTINGRDQDGLTEANVKLRSLYINGGRFCDTGYAGNTGLFTPNYCEIYDETQKKCRIYGVRYLPLDTLAEKTSIVEVRYFLSNDFNRNGYYDGGEFFIDSNWNGIPNYQLTEEIISISNISQNYSYINNGNKGDKIFAIKIEEQWKAAVDIDVDSWTDSTSWKVDGADEDNAGCFDWLDLDNDGDLNDAVSFQGVFFLNKGSLYDYELGDIFLPLAQVADIYFFISPCFSGEMIGNLPGVIEASTPSWNYSYDNTHELALAELGLKLKGDPCFVATYYDWIDFINKSDKHNTEKVFNLSRGWEEYFVFATSSEIEEAKNKIMFLSNQSPVIVKSLGITSSYKLFQNYPNPFNSTTTISYSLQTPGKVKLSVFNLLGEKIATLIDGFESAGEHQEVWNAVNVSSGVYIYRLETDNGVLRIKKMELMR